METLLIVLGSVFILGEVLISAFIFGLFIWLLIEFGGVILKMIALGLFGMFILIAFLIGCLIVVL